LLLPHLLALTLVVKPVHLGDLPRFVVPSNERCSFGIPDLQGAQHEECLDIIQPPINEIDFSEKVWDERRVFFGNDGADGVGGGWIGDGVVHVND
jgi:hypothetical protein